MKPKRRVKAHAPERPAVSRRGPLITKKPKYAARPQYLAGLSRGLYDILDSVPDNITLMSPDLNIVWANRAALDMMGGDARRIIGKKCHELWHHQTEPCRVCPVNRSSSSGRQEREQVTAADGSFWEVRTSPIRDRQGRIKYIVDVARNITKQVLAKTELLESEEKFRILAETSPAGIYLLQDGVFKYANTAAAKIFGYSVGEVVNKKRLRDFAFPEDLQLIEQNVKKRIRGEVRTIHYEFRGITKDKRIINVEVYGSRTMYREKPAIIGTVFDITERKMNEQRLVESEEKFRALADRSPIGIFIVQDDKIRYVNPVMAGIFGYTREEVTDKKRPDEFVADTHKALVEENIRQRIVGKVESVHYEFKGVTRQKKLIDLDLYGSRILYQGRPAIIGSMIDITEKKEAAQEKERIREQVFQFQKMEAIGLLAGGIAHDLNNLLTVIHGHAELGMMRSQSESQLRPDFEEILHASASGRDLTRQLLLFSRKHPIKLSPVNINTTIESMLGMVKRLLGENITVTTEYAPGLWNVMADAGNIEQVVMNLAVNARDALPAGGSISIKTENVTLDRQQSSAIPEAHPGDFVRLSVADNGGGIDEEVVSHIFEPFFTTKKKGTGLGLSVVYGISKQHKGWISVSSVKDKGTTFSVYLPAVLSEHQENVRLAVSYNALAGKGERVLAVEDEEVTLDFIKVALGDNGYAVFTASTVEEALRVFGKEDGNIDLVFSDVVLPDGMGIELVEKLSEKKQGLRFMLSSGYTEDKSRLALIRARGYRFLQKPYTLHDLLTAVKDALENGEKKEQGKGGPTG